MIDTFQAVSRRPVASTITLLLSNQVVFSKTQLEKKKKQRGLNRYHVHVWRLKFLSFLGIPPVRTNRA